MVLLFKINQYFHGLDHPLPTDYWTRPATTMNREWWPILGNYPGTGVVGGGSTWPADTNNYALLRYGYEPYVQGPKSAHVVWKQPYNIGGLIGGSMGTNTIWASAQVIYGHPTIIYSGRAYWTTTKVVDGNATSVWECYDITNRTNLLGPLPSSISTNYDYL